MTHLVSPSLLSADFGNLQRDIEMINTSEADWFHLDIMDGMFVPNISFGFPVIKYIKKHAKKPLDVHLMIVDPDRYIDDFYKVGADILTVHYEACNHLHRTFQNIKSKGIKAGVSLNPHTPVHLLKDIIADVDLVLIMSVNPGFGGQKFIPNSIEKIKELKQLITDKKSNALIEVDGGVDNTNAKDLVEAGCDVLVAGSYIFSSNNQLQTIKELRNLKF
ncbi:MAG: ribulose-phosphate 3-epimerase [Bacteroidales bacterium]|nr:ribulose-phosphate 3-epimerase [Bacteroidales bacterium]